MPRISYFYGISIYMHFYDHNPPHFHARYGRTKALVSIDTGDIVAGDLPRTAKRLVKEWALSHQAELLENWTRAQAEGDLERIPGPDGAG
jgi:hypothetical protein